MIGDLILRPLNYPKGTPGQGFHLVQGRTGWNTFSGIG